ncbi:MAG: hypothetical protein Q4E69_00365 [Bacilli bacterium]|nr:hypothetical protein [Bacilli bacterium]
MKNKLIIALILIISGIIVGNNLYSKVDFQLLKTFKENNDFYLLQLGTYDSKEDMQRDTRDINPKVYEIKNNKYYVYVGISSNINNINKIKDIYSEKELTTKVINIKDEEFITNLRQFDILIDNTNNKDEVLTIEEVVLSSFNKKILE